VSSTDTNNVRDILQQLGIGHFNATMMIQDCFIAPATSDPRSPQIILMVQHIQAKLQDMGAPIAISGRVDPPTARYLVALMGDNVLGAPWYHVIGGVLDAQAAGVSLAPNTPRPIPQTPAPVSGLSGLLDAPSFLPDVPGGLLTYGIAGYFLYKHFKKKG
jgi:hypothetical protein